MSEYVKCFIAMCVCQLLKMRVSLHKHLPVADCGSLVAPENGTLTIDSTTFESTVNYSCDEGYNIAGDEMRTCQENGSWSGQKPVCQSECFFTYSMCVCVLYCMYEEMKCDHHFSVLLVVDCFTLTNPTNGQVSLDMTTFGAVANYSCNEGYILMGPTARACQSNENWTDDPPLCQST